MAHHRPCISSGTPRGVMGFKTWAFYFTAGLHIETVGTFHILKQKDYK